MALAGVDDAGNPTALEFAPQPDGSFATTALSLAPGDNRYTLVQTDAAGNVSKTAQFHVRRSDAPATPVRLNVLRSDNRVQLAWEPNEETNLLGYRVKINGADAPDMTRRAELLSVEVSSWSDEWPVPELYHGNQPSAWMPHSEQALAGQWLAVRFAQSTYGKIELAGPKAVLRGTTMSKAGMARPGLAWPK